MESGKGTTSFLDPGPFFHRLVVLFSFPVPTQSVQPGVRLYLWKTKREKEQTLAKRLAERERARERNSQVYRFTMRLKSVLSWHFRERERERKITGRLLDTVCLLFDWLATSDMITMTQDRQTAWQMSTFSNKRQTKPRRWRLNRAGIEIKLEFRWICLSAYCYCEEKVLRWASGSSSEPCRVFH